MRQVRVGRVLAFLFFLGLGTLYAGETGKITGRVVDKETGDPLPGASVVVVGTQLGAAADLNGYYVILNVPPGTYTLRASMVGYADEEVSGVVVRADGTTEINFALLPEVIQTEPVEVVAKRPVVEKRVTTTQRIVETEELQALPYENFQQVVNLQAGVTQSTEFGFIVRGGREDEVAYYIDGLPVSSPVFGGFAGVLNNAMIKEFTLLTGGFSAEYGQAMSGVVNVVTREGGPKYSGQMLLRSDALPVFKENSLGYNRMEFGFGGPILPNLRFFVSGTGYTAKGYYQYRHSFPDYIIDDAYENGTDAYRAFVDTAKYAIGIDENGDTIYRYYREDLEEARYWEQWWKDHPAIAPNTDRYDYQLQTKLTFFPFNSGKLIFNLFRARSQYNRFSRAWVYHLDHYRADLRKQLQVGLTFNHLLKNNLVYNLRVGLFRQDRAVAPKDLAWWSSVKGDFFRTFFEDFRFLGESVFDSIMNLDDPSQAFPVTIYQESRASINSPRGGIVVTTPWGQSGGRFMPFVITGDWGVFHKRTELSYILKGDVTYQPNRIHEIKAGVEAIQYSLRLFEAQLPWDERPFLDFWQTQPRRFAAYVKDKMEFQGFFMDAGLRLDYIDPNFTYYFLIHNPDTVVQYIPGQSQPERAKPSYQLSPRLSFSFPISENQVFRFNFGYFFQEPPLTYYYEATGLDPGVVLQRGNRLVGNPALSPQKTVQFEAGVATAITPDLGLDIAAFYKDIYGWVGTRMVRAIPLPFFMYFNSDFGNVKGLEVTLKKRGRPLQFHLAYTLQWAEGTASDPYITYQVLVGYNPGGIGAYLRNPETGELLPAPHLIYPLNYDRRHSISLALTYTTPSSFLRPVLNDLDVTFVNVGRSGTPYTPLDERGNPVGEPNSARNPWEWNTDMKLSKNFRIGNFRVGVIAEVLGLFEYVRFNYQNLERQLANIRRESFGDQIYAIGDPNYDPRQDLNGDGLLTGDERYEAYVRAWMDYNNYPGYTGSLRTFRLGVAISF